MLRLGSETILLAEDNEDHVLFIKRSFMQARLLNPVQVVHDGLEAIAYLKGDGKFADRDEYPFPALLLLDLKMPNKDGFEVMEWIRSQPAMQNLKIVVLTTSDRIFDVKRAYALGANSFLTKPLNVHQFIQLGPAIKGFWLWSSREPEQAPDGDQRQSESAAFSPASPLVDLPGQEPAASVPEERPVT